jgi:hypothetical protein
MNTTLDTARMDAHTTSAGVGDLPVEKAVQTIVYRTVHVPTGRIYIGVHTLPPGWPSPFKCDDYQGSGEEIKAAVAEHGWAEFRKDVLLVLDDRAAAYEVESGLVGPDQVASPMYFNLCCGGYGAIGRSEESRRRQGESLILGRFRRNRLLAGLPVERKRDGRCHRSAESSTRSRAWMAAYWASKTPAERSAEMKRRAAERRQRTQEVSL